MRDKHTLKDTMQDNKQYRKTGLTLPSEVSSAFARTTDMETRNAYVRALRKAHWTLQAISDASGITRERVRQIVNNEPVDADGLSPDIDGTLYPVPEPPVRERPEPRVYVEPDPAKLARLLELKPLAQKVGGNRPAYRAEAEEYAALLAEVHLKDGVTLYRLAKRLGVTHGALRFKLARYGHKQPPNGSSKVYDRIRPENRVGLGLDTPTA